MSSTRANKDKDKDKSRRLRIVVDERERAFFDKCSECLGSPGGGDGPLGLEKRTLDLGDILFEWVDAAGARPLLLFERKTLPDLMASIRDGRYDEQGLRLARASGLAAHNVVYLLEGMAHAHLPKPDERRKFFSSLTSLLVFKGFSVLRTVHLQESVDLVLGMADKMRREILRSKSLAVANPCWFREPDAEVDAEVDAEAPHAPPESGDVLGDLSRQIQQYVEVIKSCKKANITQENIGEILLCQLPGISAVTARAVMEPFRSFADFFEELRRNPGFVDEVRIEGKNRKMRRIGTGVAETIRRFLLPASLEQPHDHHHQQQQQQLLLRDAEGDGNGNGNGEKKKRVAAKKKRAKDVTE